MTIQGETVELISIVYVDRGQLIDSTRVPVAYLLTTPTVVSGHRINDEFLAKVLGLEVKDEVVDAIDILIERLIAPDRDDNTDAFIASELLEGFGDVKISRLESLILNPSELKQKSDYELQHLLFGFMLARHDRLHNLNEIFGIWTENLPPVKTDTYDRLPEMAGAGC